jgi:putative solute:sodium symporter small subunit
VNAVGWIIVVLAAWVVLTLVVGLLLTRSMRKMDDEGPR